VDPDPDLRGRAASLIGYVGEIGAQDGVDYLVRALSHLTVDLGHHDWYCLIIGDGDALDDLRKLVTQLQLDERVWLSGRLESAEVVRCLSSVDVCVVPDPSNPYNDRCTMIKLMEYMALGKPTVAFDLPEHRVTAGPGALYVTPNDEMEFARALATLMDDPALRQEMGRVGRQRVEEVLAWPHSVGPLLDVYARLGGGKPVPVPVQTARPPKEQRGTD
jgi:glycosyltransferase involved in cell wall biosynthesis